MFNQPVNITKHICQKIRPRVVESATRGHTHISLLICQIIEISLNQNNRCTLISGTACQVAKRTDKVGKTSGCCSLCSHIANEVIILPKMDKVIGMLDYVDVIAGGHAGSLREDGTIEAELQIITGATNEMGFNCMSAR